MAVIKYHGPGNRCLPYRANGAQQVCNLVPGENEVPAEVVLAVVAEHPELFEGPRPRFVAEIPKQDKAPAPIPEDVESAPEVGADEVLSVDDLPKAEEPKAKSRGKSRAAK